MKRIGIAPLSIGYIVSAFVVYVATEIALVVMMYDPRFTDWSVVYEQVGRFQGFALMCVGGVYSFFVVSSSHPIRNSAYLRALLTMPWDSTKSMLDRSPLPNRQDLFVFLFVEILAFRAGPEAMFLAFAGFVVCYSLTVLDTLARTRELTIACLLFVAMESTLLFIPFREFFVLYLGFVFLLAVYGARRSLAKLSTDHAIRAIAFGKSPNDTNAVLVTLPWPLFGLFRATIPRFTPLQRLFVAFIPAWFFFCVFWLVVRFAGDIHAAIRIPALFLFSLSSMLFVSYRIGHAPPIAILGRITTGRIFIPAYDKLLAGPFLVLGVAAASYKVLDLLGLPPLVTMPCVVFFGCLIAAFVGPSYRSWSLTGYHRLTNLRGKGVDFESI